MGLSFNGTDVDTITFNGTELTSVTFNGTEVWSAVEPQLDCLCFTANTAGSTVSFNKVGTQDTIPVYYSYNATQWVRYTFNTSIPLATSGMKVYFKGTGSCYYNTYETYYRFVMTGSIAASGNIMSLVDNGECTTTTIPSNYCFACLFRDCTVLTTGPQLPATVLKSDCYLSMFNGCTALTTAPSLPATTLKSYCYENMFNGCTLLTTPPALSATTLANYCYKGMFNGCTALTTAPSLPATTLASSCYYQMFTDCTSLTTAPALPATTLVNSCYSNMFSGCTALTTIPQLPATTFASSCYSYMFYDCTSLYVSDNSGSGYDKSWVIPSDAIGSGDYTMLAMFTNCLGSRSTDNPNFNGIQKTYYTQNHPVPYNPELCFTANTAGSTVNITKYGTPTLGQNFSYSLDTVTWTTFVPGTTTAITLANIGDKVYFKGNNPNGLNESFGRRYYFSLTGSIAASGNIMSLIDDGADNTLVIPNTYCFYNLFQNCSSLTTAPSLPATTLTEHCYDSMFYMCTSLATPPALPATTAISYCYSQMFSGCTALTSAPALPATTVADYCYSMMFSDCTALTAVPTTLPAMTMYEQCYNSMFYGCTSLNAVPTLPATTLAYGCYGNMFRSCSALTTTPSLLATNLADFCYSTMFGDCTSLTTLTVLPATTLKNGCYMWMFQGCTSLYISDSSTSSCAQSWKVPQNSSGSGDYEMTSMFESCLGTRSTDSPNFNGIQKTYYTQNTPV